ncbi:MAG: T9SS type A sorting domain-containing protein [Candidatus Electryonea clarkiae]|nr:T9SS type A sorting domain-containing protein [Candidatus Electryonea clarkiae]MDP8288292.1 T9SS type A sorting domain-containing protein [Candidatus Electryonea clarkiae]
MNGLRKLFRALLIFVALIVLAGQTTAQDSLGISKVDFTESYDSFSDVASLGEYALVASNTSGLMVISGFGGQNPEIVAQVGDDIEPVSVVLAQGDRVLTIGDYYTFYDFSNPLNPLELGRSEVTDDEIRTNPYWHTIIWHDSLLINWTLNVINIYEFVGDTARVHLSSIQLEQDFEFGYIPTCNVWNDKIYVSYRNSDEEYEFSCWDISDPEEPVERFFPEGFNLELEYFGDLDIQNGIAAITYGSSLTLINIDPPESAEILDTWNFDDNRSIRYPVFIDDHVLVRGWMSYVLLSLSFDENYNITLADSVQMNYGGHGGYCLQGNNLALAAGNKGLITIDLTDPENLDDPVTFDPVDRYYTGSRFGTALLVNNVEAGISVFDDDSDTDLPFEEVFLREGYIGGSVLSSSEDIAVVSWWDGVYEGEGFTPAAYTLQLITPNPEDQSQPVLRGIIPSTSSRFSNPTQDAVYAVSDDEGEFSLEVFDISDIDSPMLEEIIELTDVVYSGKPSVNGDYLYLALSTIFEERKLIIYSIEDPLHPDEIGDIEIHRSVIYDNIVFSGNKMFLQDYFDIRIYSIEDPENPEEIGTISNQPGSYHALDCQGDYLLVSVHRHHPRLEIYDISEPDSAVRIAWYTLPRTPSWAYMDGSRIVATWSRGTGLFDWEGYELDVRYQSSLPANPSLNIYPNPTNPDSRVILSLPVDGRAFLSIYDILGREVAVLTDMDISAGMHTFQLPGRILNSSGTYFLNAEFGDWQETQKIVILK